jgi:membrane AbrB-like protein
MTAAPDAKDDQPRFARPGWQQWVALVLVSAVFAVILHWARFPAALLVGPMLAGVIAGVNGVTVRPPRWSIAAAQAVVGCLIAGSISPAFFTAFAGIWHLTLAVVLATLAASSLLGWAISRWRVLPGTTGVWGSAPGAATAMVLMAGAFGADERLVAFMQYLRVIVVTAVTALIARVWIGASGGAVPAPDFFAPIDLPDFALTVAVAAAGALLGRLARLPTPYFLGPMILGIALEFAGLLTVELPEMLLAVSYAVVGWFIGLKFTRATIRTVRQSIVQVLASILVLVAFCGGLASLLVVYAGVDPLTAYLATSPGGMDSIAIIAAASSTFDLSFIMVVQMLRFLIVLLFGPALARTVARLVRE